MNKKEYSSNIKKTQFEYQNSLKIAQLVLKGDTYKEVLHKCFDEHLIQTISDQRRKEITNVVYERIASLDGFLLKIFVNGSITASKFILVYAIAKTDKLFFEFLYQYYRDAILGNKKYISMQDFDNFFDSVKEKSPIVKKWSRTTIEDIRTAYKSILIKSGLGEKDVKNVAVRLAVISPNIVNHIKEIGDGIYLQALLGVD